MIKQFIFAKLLEKFFKKAMQGDRRGIMKYFKIILATVFVVIVIIIIGIILFIQFLFRLFTPSETKTELAKNLNEIKIEESIKKAKEMGPEEVTTIVEQIKTKIAPYDTLIKEAENTLLKVNETVERFEKLIP